MVKSTSASQRLASDLRAAKRVSKKGSVVKGIDLERKTRERLVLRGWLHEIMRGWYILAQPELPQHGGTYFYSAYWDFLSTYLADRFGEEYLLSPESSLLLHSEATTIPEQLVVLVPQQSQLIRLPHSTSLVIARTSADVLANEVERKEGLRCMKLGRCLAHLQPASLKTFQMELDIALRSAADLGPLIRYLLERNLKASAERLCQKLFEIGRVPDAEELVRAFRSSGIALQAEQGADVNTREKLPPRPLLSSKYKARVDALWQKMAEQSRTIAKSTSLPRIRFEANSITSLRTIYGHDSYNSLSIEGYEVSPELIERIESGNFDPKTNPTDRITRDTMAAKGYQLAFAAVEGDLKQLLAGASPARVIERSFPEWRRLLFSPSVDAGLLSPLELIGFRNSRVFIRESQHIPPRHEAIPDYLERLFWHLTQESDPFVTAVMAHFLFGFIHPYSDGNGRTARFVMNAFLVSGGYPWTIVRRERRQRYLFCLEEASRSNDIVPFALFIAEELEASHEFKRGVEVR